MLKNQLIKQFDSDDVNLSFAWFEITLGRYKKAIDLLNSIHQEFNFFRIIHSYWDPAMLS
jgi:hypothetical protein